MNYYYYYLQSLYFTVLDCWRSFSWKMMFILLNKFFENEFWGNIYFKQVSSSVADILEQNFAFWKRSSQSILLRNWKKNALLIAEIKKIPSWIIIQLFWKILIFAWRIFLPCIFKGLLGSRVCFEWYWCPTYLPI